MSPKGQKQDMHGQQSKKKWFKDRLLTLVRKPGSRTPLPSPQSTLAKPSAAVNTNVPAISSQEPPRIPINSPQAVASDMVTPMEGAASPPNIHDGANIASTTANQTEISQESSKVSKVISAAGTSRIEPGNFPGSKAKDGLKTAWHGLKMILGQVEGLLDGTPFQIPVTAVNMLVQLGDAISDNHESLKELMSRIERHVETVETSLSSDDNTDMVSTKMKEDFARIILQDLSDLHKLENNRLWRNILENEQVTAEIQRILRNLVGNTEDFHLKLMLSIERNTSSMFKKLEMQQKSLLMSSG
ncbi:hypothetical protein C0992_008150 [Termitomyces sp. T32_za158]|nr:hypothetical protein C0992_008150 [Termitomyces sp. T32_za158]